MSDLVQEYVPSATEESKTEIHSSTDTLDLSPLKKLYNDILEKGLPKDPAGEDKEVIFKRVIETLNQQGSSGRIMAGMMEYLVLKCGEKIYTAQSAAITDIHTLEGVTPPPRKYFNFDDWADIATMTLLERFNDYPNDKIFMDVVGINEDSSTLYMIRLRNETENTAKLGGSREEMSKKMSESYRDCRKYLEELHIDAQPIYPFIYVLPPDLEMFQVLTSTGTVVKENIIFIYPWAETESSNNDPSRWAKYNRYRNGSVEDILGHELIHMMNTLDLPVIFAEALAALYEVDQNVKELDMNQKQLMKTVKDYSAADVINTVENSLNSVISGNSSPQHLTVSDKYYVPTALLFTLKELDPKLCGSFILNVCRAYSRHRKLDIRETIERSMSALGYEPDMSLVVSKFYELKKTNLPTFGAADRI